MKKKVLLILFLTFYITLSSDTIIPAGNVSGNWDIDGSPYLIEGEITIPDGETLTIDPGILVEFQGHYIFNIQGRILAEGTEQDSIFFTIADTTGFSNFNSTAGSWDSFEFIETPVTNDSSKFEYCRIEYAKSINYNHTEYGGAFEIRYFSKIKITNCTFKYNAANNGGIISGLNASIIIINNLFTHNFNGIRLTNSNPLIANNTFHDNSIIGEEYGIRSAGVYCGGTSNPLIIKNVFTDNLSQSGGAISIFGDCVPIIVNNLIINNESYSGGAIKLSSDCQGIIANNTICGNHAQQWGGGIDCSNVTTEIVNNIIWGNSAESSGDQIYIYMYEQNACPDFSYCDIEGGFQAFGSGGTFNFNGIYENNIDEDPLFLNNPEMPYALSDLSPCIVAGNPDTTGLFLPEYDLAGNPRIANGRIDIGAYEYQGEIFFVLPLVFDPDPGSFQYPVSVSMSTPTENAIIYYTLDGTDPDQNSNLYTQPILIQETTTIKARAYKEGLNPSIIVTGIFYILGNIIYVDVNGNGDFETIQEAVNAAINGDIIIVANGIYTGGWNRNLIWDGNEKHLYIKSENGAGYCIIDVEESGSAFNFYETNQDSTDVVEGFTIRNADNCGIICYYSSPTIIKNCLENNSSSAGGGIFLSNSNAIIKDNIIQNNSVTPAFWPSSSDGGGIYVGYGAPLVSNNIIYNNFAYTNIMETGATGGGIYIFRSDAIIENNLLSNNTSYSVSGYTTGGIEAYSYTNDEYMPKIRNNTITDNLGSGLVIIRRAVIINNICTMNSRNGLAVYQIFSGEISFNNVWGNDQNFVNCPTGVGNTSWGTNNNGTPCDMYYNISEDPLFVSTWDRDNFLSQMEAGQNEQSPCVNAGSGIPANFGLENHTTRTDLIWDDGIVDMGFHYPGIILQDVEEIFVYSAFNYKLTNYPNPFNPSTTIQFTAECAENAEIFIYNIKGQQIRQYSILNSQSSIIWDGRDENNQPVSSGIYFYQLRIDGNSKAINKMLLLK